MRRSQLAAIFAVIALMSWPSTRVLHSDTAPYTIEDLGTLDGAPLTPRGINASGHVVGTAATSDGATVGFLFDGQSVRNLGSLGGTFTEASAINDRDEVVGSSAGSDWVVRAFRFTSATGMTPLALPDGYASRALAVNASGQIAGFGGSDAIHAFRYTEGGATPVLDVLSGPESYGHAINQAGQLSGCTLTADSQLHAFRWDDVNSMLDLGTLGGRQSCGESINRDGAVAGWSTLSDEMNRHAFRYSAGGYLQDLGTLGGLDSGATAIDDSGTVIGWSTTTSGEQHAFVFTDADGLVDLNSRVNPAEEWVLTDANGLNASGQIVGVGLLRGERRAFRLTPPAGGKAILDRTPPAIASITAWPEVLWPPHGEMVSVRVRASATDEVDPAPLCRVTLVTSSEPDSGTSNQDRPHDIVLRSDSVVRLRAELGHKSRERVYTITVTCGDAAGNEATSQTTVRVVKNPWELFRR